MNWLEYRKSEVCKVCYWAAPEAYKHVALREIRRLDVVWTGEEIKVYEALKQRATMLQTDIPDYVKAALKRHIESDYSPR